MLLNELMLYVLSVYVRAYKNFLSPTVNRKIPKQMLEKCVLACMGEDVFENISDYKLVEYKGVLCYENPRYNVDSTKRSAMGGMKIPFRREVIEYLIDMCILNPIEDTLEGCLGQFLEINKRNYWLMGAMAGAVCDGPVSEPDWKNGIFGYYCQSNYSNRGEIIDIIVKDYNDILIKQNPELKKIEVEYERNIRKNLEIFIEYPRRGLSARMLFL